MISSNRMLIATPKALAVPAGKVCYLSSRGVLIEEVKILQVT
jgi:hypothetical protein